MSRFTLLATRIDGVREILTPTATLTRTVPASSVATELDLAPALMKDIGWDSRAHCPVGSDARATVAVGSCQTGVDNKKGPFQFSLGVDGRSSGNTLGVDMNGGCYIQDMVNACTRMESSGTVTSCLAHTTDYLEKSGVISAADGQSITGCAGN